MKLNPRSNNFPRKLWSAAVRGAGALALALLATTFANNARAQSSPSTEPLLQSSNFTYLGGFALPSWANGATYGTSFFEYGGHGLTEYTVPSTGQKTIYMEGHAQYPGQVAQVAIPSTLVNSTNWASLPMATVINNFVDATAPVGVAPDPASCVGNPSFVYGMLAYNGRLIMADACSYGGAQTTSHGDRSLNLATTGFQGFYGFNVGTPSRALGGPMGVIPPEWQASLGGPAFTGNCCISVTGSTSAGPSFTVFDPNTVGTTNPIPGNTLLFYSLNLPVCGAIHCEATQNNIYNLTTVYGGAAFPAGTRSVLFVMATGTGPYCYGSATDCGDTILTQVKGPHAPPYRYQILAYDANDLVAVKNGTKSAGALQPYATIVLNGMPFSYDDEIKGAGFDPATNRLYIAQNYGATPRIEVYQISVPGSTASSGSTSTSTPAVPDPPTAVTVQ